MYQEIKGNLITLAKEGKFDVITHGCNCFCQMGAGIAPKMAEYSGCNKYELEKESYIGDINKLGSIDWNSNKCSNHERGFIWVINSYTQFKYGKNHKDGIKNPVDYEAITLCMRKINNKFSGMHIGLPKIGCGLAGGDWNIVREIIKKELKDCIVTVVIFKN